MFRYIDLFSGIGGFHQGIDIVSKNMNFESNCLFAADNDYNVAKIYELNYGLNSYYDLKKDETHKLIDEAIGDKELTCIFAGFPCQPFSKAGNQEGFDDEIKGTLFFEIMKIVKKHSPRYILLENVRNLKSHNNGDTWAVIQSHLENEGYAIDDVIISPNEIPNKNIPALRERFFIMAYKKSKNLDVNFENERLECLSEKKTSIYKYSNYNNGLNKYYFKTNQPSDLDNNRIQIIDMWNDLYHRIKANNGYLISPLWPHYFNETIDISNEYKWKQDIINRNRKFYRDNKCVYDEWYFDHKDFFESLNRSNKKFEWNAGDEISDIWEGIIQFRPSGVRVKKPDFIPTLVAINQTPIIGIEKRYLQPEEMAKLYGFKRLKLGNEQLNEKYKQLGNTVSVDVVVYLLEHMLKITKYGDENEKN